MPFFIATSLMPAMSTAENSSFSLIGFHPTVFEKLEGSRAYNTKAGYTIGYPTPGVH